MNEPNAFSPLLHVLDHFAIVSFMHRVSIIFRSSSALDTKSMILLSRYFLSVLWRKINSAGLAVFTKLISSASTSEGTSSVFYVDLILSWNIIINEKFNMTVFRSLHRMSSNSAAGVARDKYVKSAPKNYKRYLCGQST